MPTIDQQHTAAEAEWFQAWLTGPSRTRYTTLPPQMGDAAPDISLRDTSGTNRHLSEFWKARPAIILFMRHFGCSCLAARWETLKEDLLAFEQAGAQVVAICQGSPSGRKPWPHDGATPSLCCAIPIAMRISSTDCWRERPHRSCMILRGNPATARLGRNSSPRGGERSAP